MLRMRRFCWTLSCQEWRQRQSLVCTRRARALCVSLLRMAFSTERALQHWKLPPTRLEMAIFHAEIPCFCLFAAADLTVINQP